MLVEYIGFKKNYILKCFKEPHDFSSGPCEVGEEDGKFLISTYPKTFAVVDVVNVVVDEVKIEPKKRGRKCQTSKN